MPDRSVYGEGVTLNCSFDLEEDDLYSIKWFQQRSHRGSVDWDEFYRFQPKSKSDADIQVYPTKGINVDVSHVIILDSLFLEKSLSVMK